MSILSHNHQQRVLPRQLVMRKTASRQRNGATTTGYRFTQARKAGSNEAYWNVYPMA